MKTLKEQIHADFECVHLNVEEAGRICSWNGHNLLIAEDVRVESQEYQAQGVNADRKIIYCRDIDMLAIQTIPQIYEEVNFDGAIWYVCDRVRNPLGYLIIPIERRVA